MEEALRLTNAATHVKPACLHPSRGLVLDYRNKHTKAV